MYIRCGDSGVAASRQQKFTAPKIVQNMKIFAMRSDIVVSYHMSSFEVAVKYFMCAIWCMIIYKNVLFMMFNAEMQIYQKSFTVYNWTSYWPWTKSSLNFPFVKLGKEASTVHCFFTCFNTIAFFLMLCFSLQYESGNYFANKF